VSLDHDIRQQLKKNAEKCTHEAARLLLEEGNLAAAKDKLAYAKIAKHLLAGEEASPSRHYLAIVISFLCLLLAGFALTVHVPSTEVGLEIEAGTVSFQLERGWENNAPLSIQSIYINNLEDFIVPFLDLDNTPEVIEITGKNLVLPVFGLSAGAQIEMELQGEKLSMYIDNGVFRGEIYAADAHLLLEGESETREINILDGIPETLQFVSQKQTLDPVKVELGVSEMWNISAMQVYKLDFAKESFPSSGNFVSTIKKGKVKLLETGQSVEINKGEFLHFMANNSKRFEITRKGDKLNVIFSGTVNSIKAGPEGFERNLAPTWLEYLHHQKQLTLFWSSVVFLWGLFWSVRNFRS